MHDPADFTQWMQITCARTQSALEQALPSEKTVPTHLHEAMRYAVLNGGKHVRPLLCHAAGELVGAQLHVLDIPAMALELMHAYSLVHDDLPAMDNDAWRRGRPTVHKQYGESTALLVGDALQAQAFIVLTQNTLGLSDAHSPSAATPLLIERTMQWVHELAQASGSLGMAGGQALDLASIGLNLSRAQLERMHRLKTGALIEAAVYMGACCAPEGLKEKLTVTPKLDTILRTYARAVGLAFQVVDDLLDATSTASILGKTPGKDAKQAKPTYVSILGLQASYEFAKDLCAQAKQALEGLGPRATRLIQLADWVVARVS